MKKTVQVQTGDAIVVDYIGRTAIEEGKTMEAACRKAVEAYLGVSAATAKDAYLTEDFEIFDTSVESVAKACGVHNPQRNYVEGLAFSAGAGQMIPGFDAAVMGMQANQTKTILIPAVEAYGEWSEKNIQSVPMTQLPPKPDGAAYVVGDMLYTQMGQQVQVVSISGDAVNMDMNHPLAGKNLVFDITIKNITRTGDVVQK